MRGSLRLGAVSGIGIYIHWTFLFLIGWVIWSNIAAGAGGAALAVAFILAVFLCVVLHELGHALMAQRFGIHTRDITLLPIGGVARLERIPDDPRQELLVAIAGPLVNVIIAAALFLGLTLSGRPLVVSVPADAGTAVVIQSIGLLPMLLLVNVWLVIFNLLPAFPMDGGRILRAILALRLDYGRATRIAATVGQIMAGVFFIWGLYSSPILLLIAVFVFLGAQAEARMAEVRYGLAGLPVRDAMITSFTSLSPSDTLQAAAELLIAGSQQDFPVTVEGRIVGILPRTELVRSLAAAGPATQVDQVMHRDCAPVEEHESLSSVFQRMQESGFNLVPVTRDGVLVGLITLENIGELMMINSARRQARGPTPPREPRPGRLSRPGVQGFGGSRPV